MNYRLMGRSGLRVSELCLGTMTFGEDWGWGSSHQESRQILDYFMEAGGNFIDTANVYTNGTSETLLGEFLEGQRDRVVLATKYTNAAPGVDANAAGNHRKSMMQSVEASLRRFRTDYIDVYWLHIWDFLTPMDEVMRAFDDLVRQGKILYCGISDAPAWVVSRANTIAELRGWSPFIGLQIEYSLAERTPERDLLPMARALELAVTPWSPLAGGLLTGKYAQSSSADGRLSIEAMAEFAGPTDQKRKIAETVKRIADQRGCSAAQVALAWLTQQPGTVIPIVGARRLSQVKDNLACLEVRLSPQEMMALDEVSKVDLGFPHDFYSKSMVRGLSYGGMYDRIERVPRA
ncbi:MAG TPA: aldo/keto reductase [Bryobacteraceae bacterium]|nr:aldo/keto reductase [Bryobacteraceae bacterium]